MEVPYGEMYCATARTPYGEWARSLPCLWWWISRFRWIWQPQLLLGTQVFRAEFERQFQIGGADRE
ncbi:hypothetical protein TK43_11005 [Roseovarius sp. JS7-11]|nr:hypothetical protein TK43_11005 [Roseovarius sp. JS7-11]